MTAPLDDHTHRRVYRSIRPRTDPHGPPTRILSPYIIVSWSRVTRTCWHVGSGEIFYMGSNVLSTTGLFNGVEGAHSSETVANQLTFQVHAP